MCNGLLYSLEAASGGGTVLYTRREDFFFQFENKNDAITPNIPHGYDDDYYDDDYSGDDDDDDDYRPMIMKSH